MKIPLPALLILLLAPYIKARQYPVNKVQPDPHRFIVRYKNDEGKANVHTAAEKVHAPDLGPQNAIAVTLSTPEALESLQSNPHIEYVEPDYPRYITRMRGYESKHVLKQPTHNNNETRSENHRKLIETIPYGVPMVQADQVSYDSSNPRTICIIDTGYDLGHEDLPSTDVDGFSFDADFPWNQDGDGHGTHVAGRSPINVMGLFDTTSDNESFSNLVFLSLFRRYNCCRLGERRGCHRSCSRRQFIYCSNL
jgi:serine protease